MLNKFDFQVIQKKKNNLFRIKIIEIKRYYTLNSELTFSFLNNKYLKYNYAF